MAFEVYYPYKVLHKENCEFTLRDACVAYQPQALGGLRLLLIQTNVTSHSTGWEPIAHPGTFVEGQRQPIDKLHRDDLNPQEDRPALEQMARVWHTGL